MYDSAAKAPSAPEKPQDRIKLVPPESRAAIDALQRALTPEKMDDFYGVNETAPEYHLFHGTILSKLPKIAAIGMKAFQEPGQGEPRIFGTVSPTMALWHAWENRPHDTLRKRGEIEESETRGQPVLLLLTLSKEWVATHPDSQKPLPLPWFLKEEKGITPEKDNRLWGFHQSLSEAVKRAKTGKEANDFGTKLPIDELPPECIFVQTSDGRFQPIREYVKEHRL